MKFWFGQKDKQPEESAPATDEGVATPAAEAAPETAAPASAPAVPAPASVAEAPAPAAVPAATPEVPPPLVPPAPAPAANPRAQFRELINGLYDAIFILDDGGRVVSSNRRVQKVFGYTEDDLWDMPITKIVKGVHALIFKQMRDALHNSQQVLINTKCLRKDGTEFSAEVGVSLVHLMRNENLVFAIRNVESRVASLREQIAKELREKFPDAAAALSPSAKPRLVLKKAAAAPQG